MQPSDVRAFQRRTVLLGAFFLLAAIAYAVSFFTVKAVVDFGEETFKSATTGGARPLDLYLDVLAIDPVRASMDIRLDVSTGPGPHGSHYGDTFDRDLMLHVSDGDTDQEIRLRRNGPLASRIFSAGLNGTIGRYPFDRYVTHVVLSARERSSKNVWSAIPLRATVWEGVPSWALRAVQLPPLEGPRELRLSFDVRRPAPLVFFACVIYGLMVLIAVSAAAVAALVFLGAREVEVGQVSALAAMVFALPVLRNLLPGSPPLGVSADLFILLWTELVVALGLTLVVITWVQRGGKTA